MRSDIADIRLAEQVFAPHYAVPMERVLVADAVLYEDATGSMAIAHLQTDDVFEVLDLSGNTAWGVAQKLGLVGYIAAAAIEGVAPQT